jgi:trk system potassium uptake protein TrkA
VAGRTVSEIAADSDFPRSCVFAGLFGEGAPLEAPRGGSVVRGGMTVLLVARRHDLGDVICYFLQGRASRAPESLRP